MKRHRRVTGIKRSEVIDVLMQIRALTLHVSVADLHAAIAETDRDHLEFLVVHNGALACQWRGTEEVR